MKPRRRDENNGKIVKIIEQCNSIVPSFSIWTAVTRSSVSCLHLQRLAVMLHRPTSFAHESLRDRSAHQDSRVRKEGASPKARPPVGSRSTAPRSGATSNGSRRVALWPRRRGQANIQSWTSALCSCSKRILKLGHGLPTARGEGFSWWFVELG
jgi:hypothetical protein